MNWFLENVDKILEFIGAASILAGMTPTKTDNKILGFIAAIIHAAAINFKASKAAIDNKRVVATSKPKGELND